MYKMLLVDDERFMLTYLQTCIAWNTLDVEIVACAHNGAQAIEQTRLFKPDIVITDIVMPQMCGLDFIKSIYGQYKGMKIIILSGHQNFEYAKEALLYGVIDYVVKPSLVRDIESAVKKAIAAIELDRYSDATYQKALADLKRSLPDIKRSFFNMLGTPDIPRTQIDEKCELLQFWTKERTLVCLRFLLDLAPEVENELIQRELMEFDQYLRQDTRISQTVFSSERNNTCTWLISVLTLDASPVATIAEQYLRERRPQQVACTICISEAFCEITQASSALAQIASVLSNRCCSYESRLLTNSQPNAVYNSSIGALEPILSAVRGLSAEECRVKTQALLQLAVVHQQSMHSLRNEISNLLRDLDALLITFKVSLLGIFAQVGFTEAELECEESLTCIENRVVRLLEQCIVQLSSCACVQYPQPVMMTIQYIEKHYRETINVSDIAQRLYLSPNYLSMLFKKHAGTSISEYITLFRVSRAKELMAENCTLKTYEVADMVGYNDYEYFRKVFKKYVGINPARYRTEIIPDELT